MKLIAVFVGALSASVLQNKSQYCVVDCYAHLEIEELKNHAVWLTKKYFPQNWC